jgi:hypothetical protein
MHSDFESSDSDSETGSDGPSETTKMIRSVRNRVDVDSDDDGYPEYIPTNSDGESEEVVTKPPLRSTLKKTPKQATDDLIVEPSLSEGFSKATTRADFPYVITRVCCIYELYKVVHIYLIHLNDYL